MEEGDCTVGEPGVQEGAIREGETEDAEESGSWMEGSQRAEVLVSTQDVEDSAL